MKKHLRTMLALLLPVAMQVHAQTKVVTGTVTSGKDKSTVPGISVSVPGTTIGTSTNIEGKYSIGVPEATKQLHFSGVGFKTKDVDITGGEVNVEMDEDILRLDEAVVTALGISREKKALGYSTQIVGAEQLNTSGTGNALGELNGKVSGLTVINSGGDPGSGTYIRMRGVTSLTGNNQPLIVVDGIPMDNSINNYDPTNAGFQASNANGNTTGGVNPDNRGIDINPNDIASVTVLKGPAATALYGINAASGALIITTKKGGGGAVGGPVITFNSSYTWNKVNKLPELQNTYSQGSYGAYAGPTSALVDQDGNPARKFAWGGLIDTLYWDNTPTVWDPHGSIVGKSDTAARTKVTSYNPTDLFQTGMTADNNIAVAGGNDKSGYRMSLGNVDDKGIIPLSKYKKTTLSLSGQSSLSTKFSASATINYTHSTSDKVQQGSNISGIMLGTLRTPPTFDNSNGASDPVNSPSSYVLANGKQRDYRGGRGYDNPYWTINRNPYHQNLDRIYGSAQVDYNLLDWMKLTYRIGGDVYAQNTKNAYDINSNAFTTGAIYLTDYFSRQYNSDFIVNMHKSINQDFSWSAVAGYNYFTSTSGNQFVSGSNFALPTFFDITNATSLISSETKLRKRTQAFYAQGELGWKSQLYFTVTGRDETSSTLPASKNNFFYPSASLGWIFTEPLGLANNKTFSYGKLRLSIAGSGKDAPIYGLQTYYNPVHVFDGFTAGDFFPFNGLPGYAISSQISTLGNPNLKPEFTNTTEIGADFSFLQNRISLSFTYYNEKTTDAIFTVPISYATGYASALENAATLTNKGEEISLNLTPVKMQNGFQWDITLNWSHNSNMVTELAPGIENLFIAGFQNGGIYAVAGKPFGQIYGNTYVHVDPNDASSALLINDNKADPGYGMPIVGSINQPIGDINPKWIGSGISTFTYKGISLGFQVDIKQGGDIWDGTRGALAYFGTAKETENRGTSNTFSGSLGHLDANGNVVHYGTDGVTEVAGGGSANSNSVKLDQYYYQNIGSSFIGPASIDVEKGSYVRLKQVSLGYNFPKAWIKKAHLTSLGLTIFANNPKLWTDYKGVDPETSLTGPANGQGLDYFNNPGIKSWGLRLSVGI